MSPSNTNTDPELPLVGESACGARIRITSNTPYIHYRGEIVYFCGWDCKQIYDEDPMNSCMAARLLSGK
jgi:YHS domain-containing protein